MLKQHWLQLGESDFCWIMFEVQGEMMRVKGVWGATYAIDAQMTKPEAREFWKKKLTEGWFERKNPKNINRRQLELLMYN